MSQTRRRIDPAKLKEKVRPYWWWQGASVTELLSRLTANPDARLEVHIDAEQHATFVVVPQGGDAETKAPLNPINESFVCPPKCP